MATVAELAAGDLVTSCGMSAVFITRSVHPDYPTLMLVAWRLGETLGGGWSFDALRPDQDVGQVVPSSIRDRTDRLRAALAGEEAGDDG
jgi:hypothetical protein